MKRTTQLIGASLLAIAVVGLGGCFGNGDDNSYTPPPPPPPPPTDSGGDEQPQSTAFSDFVKAQFAADTRDSETAKPVDVNSMDFTFADQPDPQAYDCLFTKAGCGSGN